ncbi:C-type lectin 37Db-like [Drosophila gunungcola]|uniref:C-type lectin 37Db-like n=1 Tax=Drosophila gunungcola TaxID=103775 RepID=UPI0022E3B382|nr:C-type lectin 37Db-like [Drosophila gunungcola]
MFKTALLLSILSAAYQQGCLARDCDTATSNASSEFVLHQQSLISLQLKLITLQENLFLAGKTLKDAEETRRKQIAGFEKIGSRYFYIESHLKRNWWGASDVCRQKDGFLAAPRSSEELSAIKLKLTSGQNYWVGISDLGDNVTYVSQATGQPAFLMWATWEPSRVFGNKDEDCVELMAQRNYFMNDIKCNTRSHFICELSD